ncbi:MAG: hypothetical protein NXI01_00715 [Gammaproteobacteria bacterium]|nr:hypothetical protein [Gammaproteobacteria bacterium]
MKHHTDQNETPDISDPESDQIDDSQKREIRRKLEDRVERQRLKEELEDYEGELDDEFDWDNLDK